MSGLMNAFVIGAISQLLFFNLSKDMITDTNFNRILFFAASSFLIQVAFSIFTKNANLNRLLIEAAVVGILTLIIGKISIEAVNYVFTEQGISKQYMVETSLIVTGVLIHLFCEFSGINAWYITNGVAAKP